MSAAATTYWDYIKVEQLLALQRGVGDSEDDLSNDEVMFIGIHQIDEIWMKLALRELVSVRDVFAQPDVPETAMAQAVRGLGRAAALLDHMTDHFALMETMTTRDYLGFRRKLSPASGFQSAQLREIEIVLGLPEEDRIPIGKSGYLGALRNADGSESSASARVVARQAERESKGTLLQALVEWLYRTPVEGSSPGDHQDTELVEAFVQRYCAAHRAEGKLDLERAAAIASSAEEASRLEARFDAEARDAEAFIRARDIEDPVLAQRTMRVRAALVYIESHRELALLAWPREVLDAVVTLEQSFVVFRQRHARMVERVIGHRTGTGGSAGVKYLDRTALEYRIFKDVWAARTVLIRQQAVPPPRNAGFYELVGG